MAYAERLKSGKWRGRYRNAARELCTAPDTYPTKRLALAAAQNLEADVRRNVWSDPRAGHILYADWAEEWWEKYRSAEETSNATARGRLDALVVPEWGKTCLDAIDPAMVQAWVNRLSKGGMAARTVKAHYDLLSASLSAAVMAKRLTAHPGKGIRLPTPPAASEVYYTVDQVEVIAAWIEEMRGRPDRVVAELLFWTGLRWGEAAGLHVPSVDLEAGTVDVVCAMVEVPPRRRVIKPYTKGKRRRTVGIPAPLLPMLREHLDELPRARSCGFEHAEGRCRGGLVFRHWRPVHPRSHRERPDEPGMISRHHYGHYVWHQARDAAGDDVPYGRVQDLRHSHASYLAQHGITITEIQEQLGHESITTTQRYAHLCKSTTRSRIMGVLNHTGTLRAVEQNVEQNSGQQMSITVHNGASDEAESPAV